MVKEGTAEVGCRLGLSHTFHQVELPWWELLHFWCRVEYKTGRSSVKSNGRVVWEQEGAVGADHLLANWRSRGAATVWPHGGSKY